METRNLRPITLFATAAALFCLFGASPALSLTFTVHGYDVGERIQVDTGSGVRSVWTAELDISLDTVADHVSAFCVDLDSYIGKGAYPTIGVYDASTAGPGSSPSGPRNFAWAGHVMVSYGHDVDALATHAGVTRDQAITGVQAAIWQGLYAGPVVDVSSLSGGAQTVFDKIMADAKGPWATGALIVDLPKNQDQVIAAAPVPEPSAALVFGLGTVVAGSFVRRRR